MAAPEMLSPLMVEKVTSALHRRVWSFNRDAGKAERLLVLLTDGNAEIDRDGEAAAIEGPAIQWIGDVAPTQLRLDPGTTGYVARIGVPAMMPLWEMLASSAARARPKSVILTR